jgi:hypothetical protein
METLKVYESVSHGWLGRTVGEKKQLISGLLIKRLTQNIDGEWTKQNRNSNVIMIIN